jgi:hypothetical protein
MLFLRSRFSSERIKSKHLPHECRAVYIRPNTTYIYQYGVYSRIIAPGSDVLHRIRRSLETIGLDVLIDIKLSSTKLLSSRLHGKQRS